MKRLILATAVALIAGGAAAEGHTPAPQAVLDATAGEDGMQIVLPLTIFSGLALLIVLASN